MQGTQKDMVITDVRLIEKMGGKSGYYIFDERKSSAKVISINISRQKVHQKNRLKRHM